MHYVQFSPGSQKYIFLWLVGLNYEFSKVHTLKLYYHHHRRYYYLAQMISIFSSGSPQCLKVGSAGGARLRLCSVWGTQGISASPGNPWSDGGWLIHRGHT